MAQILILEDDINHLELLSEVIKFGGHQSWTAHNSDNAFKIIKHQNIDLIITDISLTNESGLDFIDTLQKEDINIPFIIVSGSTDPKDKQKAKNLNALRFLTKPVDPETLLKVID